MQVNPLVEKTVFDEKINSKLQKESNLKNIPFSNLESNYDKNKTFEASKALSQLSEIISQNPKFNNSNSNNNIIKSWIFAFDSYLSPFMSNIEHDLFDWNEIEKFLNLSQVEIEKIKFDLIIVKMLQFSILAHGSQACLKFEKSKAFGYKAYKILKIIVKNENTYHMNPQDTKFVLTTIDLLCYYFLGIADFYKSENLCSIAYKIYVSNKNNVENSLAYRVFALNIASSICINDIDYWLSNSRQIITQLKTPYELTGLIIFALYLTSAIFSYSFSVKEILPSRPLKLTEKELNHKISVLNMIEESEKVIIFFESSTYCINNPGLKKNCHVFKAILNACRSLILWQSGFESDAIDFVHKSILEGGPIENFKLYHLISLSYSAQVARHLNQKQYFKQIMKYLYPSIENYPLIKIYYEHLSKPLLLSKEKQKYENQFKDNLKSSSNSIYQKELNSSNDNFMASEINYMNINPPINQQSSSIKSEEEQNINFLVPMRPSPRKLSFENARIQFNPLQSISPQLQGISPLNQGLSPFTPVLQSQFQSSPLGYLGSTQQSLSQSFSPSWLNNPSTTDYTLDPNEKIWR